MSDCELDNSAIASAHYNKPYIAGRGGVAGSCSSDSDSDENFQDVNTGNLFEGNLDMISGNIETAEEADDSDDGVLFQTEKELPKSECW